MRFLIYRAEEISVLRTHKPRKECLPPTHFPTT